MYNQSTVICMHNITSVHDASHCGGEHSFSINYSVH